MVLAMATSASPGNVLSASERAANSDVFFRRAVTLCEKHIRHGTSLEIGTSSHFLCIAPN
jgi:hypothetical protein